MNRGTVITGNISCNISAFRDASDASPGHICSGVGCFRRYLMLLLLMSLFIPAAQARPSVYFSLSASSVMKNEEFNASLRVSSLDGAGSVQATVAWDTRVFTVVSSETSLPNSTINYDNNAGTASLSFDTTGETGSTVTLGALRFRVDTDNAGEYPLRLTTAYVGGSSDVNRRDADVSVVRPSLSFSKTVTTVTEGQVFSLEIYYRNERRWRPSLRDITVEISFENSAFKALDGMPSYPAGDSDGQMQPGPEMQGARIVENGLYNSTGRARLVLEHSGERGAEILLATIKFEVLQSVPLSRQFSFVQGWINDEDFQTVDGYDAHSTSVTVSDKLTTETTGQAQTISGPGGTEVELPADALLSPVNLTISRRKFMEQDALGYLIRPADSWATQAELATTEVMYEIGPPTAELIRPVRITIPFETSDVPAGFSAGDMKVYKWIPVVEQGSFRSAWKRVGGAVSSSPRQISFATERFGVYALVADKFADENVLNVMNLYASPNPFAPTGDGYKDRTMIYYDLSNRAVRVWIGLFDVTGRELRVLVDDTGSGDYHQQGTHIVEWDGRDGWSTIVPDGIYVLHLEATDIFGNVRNRNATVVVSRNLRR